MYLYKGFNKAKKGKVSENTQVTSIKPIDPICDLVKRVFIFWYFPNKKEGFSDILISRTSISVNWLVHEGSDFIDKD